MKKQLLILLMLVLLPLTSASAVKIASLYQADIPVSSQSESARIAAAKQGLLAVLIRMTGNTQVEKNPEVINALTNADDFVQTTHYTAMPGGQQVLTLRFNKGGINLLLKSAGISKWSDERPLLLVWMTQLSPQLEAEILNQHSQNQLIQLMRQDGQRLGLPLVFPMMDIADNTQVSVHDITSFNLPILNEAGRRYAPNAMLIGTLEPGEDKLEGRWRLVIGDKQWEWALKEKSQALMVAKLMEQVSQVLSANYVAAPQQHPVGQQVSMKTQDVFDNHPVEGWTF